MKTHSRVAALGLIIVLLGGLAWLLSSNRSREPVYAGRPLSYWLKAFDYSNRLQSDYSSRDASRAVRYAGTNGIPVYLRMLQARDSQLKLQLMALAQKQHLVKVRFTTAESRRRRAVTAFQILGVRARVAVPELIRLYNETPLVEAKVAIADALLTIGPAASDAVPVLQAAANSTNSALRTAANNALQNINRAAGSFDWESYALNGLRDFDTRKQADAARSLYGELFHFAQSRSGPAVPVLIELLKQPRTNSYWLRFALEHLDPDAAASVRANSTQSADNRNDSPAESANVGAGGAASKESARLLAVGDWSDPAADRRHKLRGRLLVYESPKVERGETPWRNTAVFLELQEITGAINHAPATVYCDFRDGLECELRDARGNPAPRGPAAERAGTSDTWIIVPFDGSVRFQVDSLRSVAVSKPDGLVVQFGARAWHIPAGVTNDYFLSATLIPPTNHKSPLDYDVWGETLKLPPVRIAAPKP